MKVIHKTVEITNKDLDIIREVFEYVYNLNAIQHMELFRDLDFSSFSEIRKVLAENKGDILSNKVADEQREALYNSIKEFIKFISYAEHNSRYAVPGEVDNILEGLEEVLLQMYPK